MVRPLDFLVPDAVVSMVVGQLLALVVVMQMHNLKMPQSAGVALPSAVASAVSGMAPLLAKGAAFESVHIHCSEDAN